MPATAWLRHQQGNCWYGCVYCVEEDEAALDLDEDLEDDGGE